MITANRLLYSKKWWWLKAWRRRLPGRGLKKGNRGPGTVVRENRLGSIRIFRITAADLHRR
jgi:hypothetical protein